jgi:hypothetical protein
LATAVATVAVGAAVDVALLEVGLPAVAVLAAVLGTTFRATGRGFGSGTLLAQASPVNAAKPIVSVRLVARAVDRNAAARTRRFTAFLRGESLRSLKRQVYLIEYAGKILITRTRAGVCTRTAAKSRLGPMARPFAGPSDPI